LHFQNEFKAAGAERSSYARKIRRRNPSPLPRRLWGGGVSDQTLITAPFLSVNFEVVPPIEISFEQLEAGLSFFSEELMGGVP
jgi:hypothetical protein